MSDIIPAEHDGHSRQSLQLMARAARLGWDIPDAVLREGAKYAAQIVANGNSREKLRALEVRNTMRDSNISAIQALDRLERLDNGQPTEILTLGKIIL